MNLKQKSLLVLRSIINEEKKDTIGTAYLTEKLDACMDLINPEVLLSEKAKGLFDKYATELSNKGKIIYKQKPKVETVVNLGSQKNKLI